MKEIYLLLLSALMINILNAQKVKLFSDDFTNCDNHWKELKNDTCNMVIRENKYIITNKTPGNKCTYSLIPVNIDQTKDFIIETTILQTGGAGNQNYGITWGYKDDKNNFSFCVSSNGKYKISRRSDGNEHDTIWTGKIYYNPTNSPFRLKIYKAESIYYFYANDYFLSQIPFETFYGNSIGFKIDDSLSVEIDNLTVYQVPENSASGIKIPDNMAIIFNEEFNNNSNNWSSSCGKETFSVKDGKCMLKNLQIGRCCKIKNELNIKSENDFIIETTINAIQGNIESAFGIILGDYELENTLEFILNPSGNYDIAENYPVFPENKSDYINIYPWPNRISIFKNNGKLDFFVNGHFIESKNFELTKLEALGFIACTCALEIDDLEIWEQKK